MSVMKATLNMIKNFIKGASERNLSIYAAGSAFFVILSIVPILVIVSCMIPFTGLTEEIVVEAIVRFLPVATRKFMVSLVEYVYSNSTGMLPIAVVIAVWSAGKGMLSLIRGLNEIHGITEKRGYFKLRIISSFYTVILLAGLIFTLIVSVFGQSIYENFLIQIPVLHEIIEIALACRYWISVLLLSVIFTLLYTFVPDIKTSLRKQFYGGVMAALGCAVFSYCFSVYVDNFNDFSSYGSISIIIIIMLWLYFTMYILMYGAYLGYYFNKKDMDK